jgi:histidine triad (HIT) family protein
MKNYPFFDNLLKSKFTRSIIGWVITHMDFLLPMGKLRETNTLIAFNHPKPDYPIHIVIVPKKRIRSLLDMDEKDNDFLQDVIRTAKSLVLEYGIEKEGYRLVLNGGNYQSLPQLHLHLISDFNSESENELNITPNKNPASKDQDNQ